MEAAPALLMALLERMVEDSLMEITLLRDSLVAVWHAHPDLVDQLIGV